MSLKSIRNLFESIKSIVEETKSTYSTEKTWRDLVATRHGPTVEFNKCPATGGTIASKSGQQCGKFNYNNGTVNDVSGNGYVMATPVRKHDTLYTESKGLDVGKDPYELSKSESHKKYLKGAYSDKEESAIEASLDEAREESPTKGTRKIASYGNDEHRAEVRYNPEYKEYQVHHYKNGKHLGEGPVSYHYSDKEDAHGTAKSSVGIKESSEYGDVEYGEGDEVRVTGKVEGQGKVGTIHSTAPSGKFHIVKFEDGSKDSYHHSDLSLNEETLDEISKTTLASYINKAARSATDSYGSAVWAMTHEKIPTTKAIAASNSDFETGKNRLAGIKKATDKLTKEEYILGYFDITESLQESALTEWITTFVKSKDNRFYGKTISERTNIAINSYYTNRTLNELATTPESIDEDFKLLPLDELTKATMKMYVKKAVKDAVKKVVDEE